jgi:LytS/YehU family sensor histidine kinase
MQIVMLRVLTITILPTHYIGIVYNIELCNTIIDGAILGGFAIGPVPDGANGVVRSTAPENITHKSKTIKGDL